jgi:hypothetical protein
MGIEWVRIKSWHAVRLTRSLTPRTLCGRDAGAGAETSAALPAGRSCENCLRIVARRADA